MKNSKVSRAKGIAWQLIEENIVILNPGRKEAHELNLIASVIWTELKNGTDIEALVLRIVNDFDVEANEARKDVEEFVFQLEKKGLVECQS